MRTFVKLSREFWFSRQKGFRLGESAVVEVSENFPVLHKGKYTLSIGIYYLGRSFSIGFPSP